MPNNHYYPVVILFIRVASFSSRFECVLYSFIFFVRMSVRCVCVCVFFVFPFSLRLCMCVYVLCVENIFGFYTWYNVFNVHVYHTTTNFLIKRARENCYRSVAVRCRSLFLRFYRSWCGHLCMWLEGGFLGRRRAQRVNQNVIHKESERENEGTAM